MSSVSNKKLWLIIITATFSLLQHFSAFSLLGVKPNLILIFFITLPFFLEDFSFYLILIGISYFLLRIEIIVDWPILIFSCLMTFSYWFGRKMPWQTILNLSILIIFLTTIFYAIISWRFIIDNPSLFMGEVLYNLVLGNVLFALMTKFFKN